MIYQKNFSRLTWNFQSCHTIATLYIYSLAQKEQFVLLELFQIFTCTLISHHITSINNFNTSIKTSILKLFAIIYIYIDETLRGMK